MEFAHWLRYLKNKNKKRSRVRTILSKVVLVKNVVSHLTSVVHVLHVNVPSQYILLTLMSV